jgi:hypothetical protein
VSARFVDRADPIIKIAITTCERSPCVCVKGMVWQIGACLMRGEAAIQAHKAAIVEAGFVIVPREATEAMMFAAGDPMWDFSSEYAPTERGLFRNEDSAEFIAGKVWRAMIDAAPKERK